MNAPLAPASVPELAEMVPSYPRVLAVGAGTKPRLSSVEAIRISTSRLQGIVEYEPSEFTFTAMAGTALRDLVASLAACSQYLPFDPMFVEAGGTLGGAVAAGLSGPGRVRFGGIRDFILGATYLNGAGRVLRVGGKVVKNAAGFDLPKFFVGSLGRFGILTELTFKVFPAPASTVTLRIPTQTADGAVRILIEGAKSRCQPEALDILPGGVEVCMRLGGPGAAVGDIAKDILSRWPGERLSDADAQRLWSDLGNFRWANPDGPLIKIALTPTVLPGLYQALNAIDGVKMHVSGAGNVAFVSLPSTEQVQMLNDRLQNFSLAGVTLRGAAPLWCGRQRKADIAHSVKRALDPENRFPSLDE